MTTAFYTDISQAKQIFTPEGNDTGLLGVPIALDATDIQYHHKGTTFPCITYYSQLPIHGTITIGLTKGKWGIIGTSDKNGNIDFDVEPFLEKEEPRHPKYTVYRIYTSNATNFSIDKSWHSLLHFNGLYLTNPKGKDYPAFAMMSLEKDYIDQCNKTVEQWKEYEKKRIDRLLILKQI